MSSFQCPKCQAWCLDEAGRGYVSGCDHYPVPERPGPYLSEVVQFTADEYGTRSPEASLVRYYSKRVALYKSGALALNDHEKLLLLFIAEAWRWRRIGGLALVKKNGESQ